MANKPMWDWMDKAEGRKDSSYTNMKKERVRQGYEKKKKDLAGKGYHYYIHPNDPSQKGKGFPREFGKEHETFKTKREAEHFSENMGSRWAMYPEVAIKRRKNK